MAEPNEAIDEKRRKLLRRKLGRLLDWHIPQIEETVGPFDPHAFDAFDSERRDLVAQCIGKLNAYPEACLDLLLDGSGDDPQGPVRDWRQFLSTKIDQLNESRPAWFAGGFGHPDYTADFECWCKMSEFTAEELLSLSAGIEPGHFPAKVLNSMSQSQVLPDEGPLRFLIMGYKQINRQFCEWDLVRRVKPSEFLKWAAKVDFDVHPEFEKRLKQYHLLPSKDEGGPAAGKKPHKREIDVIAQLFTAMAIDHLGFNPRDKRSPIPREIGEIAASMGLSVSDETVRKYLRIGAEFLPDDWEPNKP